MESTDNIIRAKARWGDTETAIICGEDNEAPSQVAWTCGQDARELHHKHVSVQLATMHFAQGAAPD